MLFNIVKLFLKEWIKNRIKFPNIHKIDIRYPNRDPKLVNAFIKTCLPWKTDIFLINGWSSGEWIDAKPYLEWLYTSLHCVQIEVNFTLVKFHSTKEFCKLINAWSNAKRIAFLGCQFDIDDPCKFGANIKFKTEFISFGDSTTNDNCKWDAKHYRFENIIKGIANCGLRDSLRTIEINYKSIPLNVAKAILNEYKLENIICASGYSQASN